MKRVLLISAHPDDMEIGMGGTAAKMATAGDDLISVVITDGRRAPDPDGIGPEKMVALRNQEGEEAAKKIGIEKTVFFGFESLSSQEVRNEATEKLKELIRSCQPDEIYTLHPELDRHSSHRAAGKVCVDAVGQLGVDIPIWAYEVWGLFAEWDRFEDISEHIETKLAAVNEHRSQIAAIDYTDGVAGLNRWRGVFADPHQQQSPARYAEVFIRLK
jgi:LmbE family N-acetylglucosaminyl deacetylase